MRRSIRFDMLLILVFGLAACGGDAVDEPGAGADEGAADPLCEPGASVSCSCSDGAFGAQTCKGDGSGWGPCVCEERDDPGGGADDRPEDACQDECVAGVSQCAGSDKVRNCGADPGTGCTVLAPSAPCLRSESCNGGRCEDKGPGEVCELHMDCPGAQVCVGGFCARMHGREYEFSVTSVRVRDRGYDIDGSHPELWLIAEAGPEAHEQGGQGVEFGNTQGGEVADAVAVNWNPQEWRVTLEEDTGIRVTVMDADVGPDEWLGAILLPPGAIAGDIKALAGFWSWAEVDPDSDLQEMSGTISPVE